MSQIDMADACGIKDEDHRDHGRLIHLVKPASRRRRVLQRFSLARSLAKRDLVPTPLHQEYTLLWISLHTDQLYDAIAYRRGDARTGVRAL